jgi:membrane protease YdiL (CAAX protease family)
VARRLLAPLGEELLFRGALFTWLRRRLSSGATVALTAAVFAAIHGFPVILPLAFSAWVSGSVSLSSRRIPASKTVSIRSFS